MRTIAHLSDLHFGAAVPHIVDALIDTVRRLGPDVVAVSGDLTQRARRSQFLQARAFLDALPGARIVVPGNHDGPALHAYGHFSECHFSAQRGLHRRFNVGADVAFYFTRGIGVGATLQSSGATLRCTTDPRNRLT